MVSSNVSSQSDSSLPGPWRRPELNKLAALVILEETRHRKCYRQKYHVIVVVNKSISDLLCLLACSLRVKDQHWLHRMREREREKMSERAGERKGAVGAACQYATPIADAVLTARQQTHDRVPCAPFTRRARTPPGWSPTM